MDSNLLKQLQLNSNLDNNDMDLLTKILGSIGKDGNINNLPKISVQEQNNLLSKLSSLATLEETPKQKNIKIMKDMNEEEKWWSGCWRRGLILWWMRWTGCRSRR